MTHEPDHSAPKRRVLAEEEFRALRRPDGVAVAPTSGRCRPTATAWDVRKMALHVLGSGDAQASFPQFVHQLRRGVPLNKEIDSHHWVDGMNELQIRERSHLSNDEIVAQLAAVGPKAVKGRWRTPPPDALPADPVRPADRLDVAEVPARRRLHP